MVALVDCNNFFCSVERVFHAGLSDKPVCVLSSNDGCIVALSQEAKALGLKRGVPLFQVREVVERNRVTIFSTNMPLYAAMSKRIVNILRDAVAQVESYSIDECFCYLDGYDHLYPIDQYMRSVAEKIKLWTDIPVSVGIASTKTLAKVASKFAKQHKGYRGVCMIDTEAKRRKALSLFALNDVWGIGRQTLRKLNSLGVDSALAFADKQASWVKSHFNKPVLQTWLELNGEACIDTSEVYLRQRICTSRSFGQMVTDLSSLKSSVATFAAGCANKLRAQQAVAGSVTVFVQSNRFRTDLPQYAQAQTAYFVVPTSDTIEITAAALKLLAQMYKPGISYKKSGVILGDISALSVQRQDLFDDVPNRAARQQLMRVVDGINQRYGVNKICLAIEGVEKQAWHNKCAHRSGNYLSDIRDLLTIKL